MRMVGKAAWHKPSANRRPGANRITVVCVVVVMIMIRVVRVVVVMIMIRVVRVVVVMIVIGVVRFTVVMRVRVVMPVCCDVFVAVGWPRIGAVAVIDESNCAPVRVPTDVRFEVIVRFAVRVCVTVVMPVKWEVVMIRVWVQVSWEVVMIRVWVPVKWEVVMIRVCLPISVCLLVSVGLRVGVGLQDRRVCMRVVAVVIDISVARKSADTTDSGFTERGFR